MRVSLLMPLVAVPVLFLSTLATATSLITLEDQVERDYPVLVMSLEVDTTLEDAIYCEAVSQNEWIGDNQSKDKIELLAFERYGVWKAVMLRKLYAQNDKKLFTDVKKMIAWHTKDSLRDQHLAKCNSKLLAAYKKYSATLGLN